MWEDLPQKCGMFPLTLALIFRDETFHSFRLKGIMWLQTIFLASMGGNVMF